MATGMVEHLRHLSVSAYHADEHDAGRRACEKLLSMSISDELERKTRWNRTYYTKSLDEMIGGCRFRRFGDEECDGFAPTNPSLVDHLGVLFLNLRAVNYRIGENGQYIVPPEDGERIRTKNLLYRLSDNLTPMDCVEVSADYEKSDFPVEGLEDIRLNSVGGDILASATVRDFCGQDGTCRIGRGFLNRSNGAVEGFVCPWTEDGIHEKNWMPIQGEDAWLYSCNINGFISVVRLDDDRWRVTPYADSPTIAKGFRGGSQLVATNGGTYVAIVHETAYGSSGLGRVYEHRFVEFSPTDYRIISVSPPFVFREKRSIEFCAGLVCRGLKLIATFGVRDCEAWAVEIPMPEVWRIMREV